jgi:hypothetical protein
MYRHASPEALSLVTLGRADSKIPDKTCRGITVAGKACRNPLKKGSRERYCHLHRDQHSSHRSKMLGAKQRETITILEEPYGGTEYAPVYTTISQNAASMTTYPTPSPSPPPGPVYHTPQGKTSPTRKPIASIAHVQHQDLSSTRFQVSPPQRIPLPTPPQSIKSPMGSPVIMRQQKSGLAKLGKAFRKLFRPGSPKSEYVPATSIYTPLPKVAFEDQPSPLPHYREAPIRKAHSEQLKQPTVSISPISIETQCAPEYSKPYKVPRLQQRPPTAVLALAQSRRAITRGVQRSWETMWVPGLDGNGAHIICKGIILTFFGNVEWLNPALSAAGKRKILTCMHAPLSAGEEAGYIYVYKISGGIAHDETNIRKPK